MQGQGGRNNVQEQQDSMNDAVPLPEFGSGTEEHTALGTALKMHLKDPCIWKAMWYDILIIL